MPKLIRLPLGQKELLFIFGPYRDRFPGTYGVKLTENSQNDAPCDLHFPIRDFGVPEPRAFEEFLAKVILLADEGHVPYIGCMGGIGRTGMVLASLRRYLSKVGPETAIGWTRRHYLSHAVETKPQEALVANFDLARVRKLVARPTFSDYVVGLIRPKARRLVDGAIR